MSDEMRVITIRISAEIDRQLRVIAALRDQNRSEFVREALAKRLAELQEKECQLIQS